MLGGFGLLTACKLKLTPTPAQTKSLDNLHYLLAFYTGIKGLVKSTFDVWSWCTNVSGSLGNHAEAETRLLAALYMPQKSIMLWCRSRLLILAGTDAEARPGVMRLIDEARQAGIKVAVCSAATKSSVIHVVKSLLGDECFEVTHQCYCIRPLGIPAPVETNTVCTNSVKLKA